MLPELGFGVLFARVRAACRSGALLPDLGTCAPPILVVAVAPIASSGLDAARSGVGPCSSPRSVRLGSRRGLRWSLPLAWALALTASAISLYRAQRARQEAGEIALGSFSAMATGAVAGTVSLAMVLGHWYLTIPTLDVAHLRQLNRVAGSRWPSP
jgi:hypothetical protein